MSRSYAIIGTDTTRDYAFSSVLCALFWRDLIAIQPYVIMVGNWTSKRDLVVRDALLKLGGIGMAEVGNVDGYATSNAAQNVREHASALPFDHDDWLIPTDADMLPLDEAWHRQHVNSPFKLVSLYSNGDHFQGKENVLGIAATGSGAFQSIPTCHTIMRAKTWRELYGIDPGKDTVAGATKRTLDLWLKPKMDGKDAGAASWEAHMSDQRILTEFICRADWFPMQAAMIPRVGHPPIDRLCRSTPERWNEPLRGQWRDAHLWKAPDEPQNWPRIRALVERYLPRHLAFVDKFRDDFWNAYNA